MYLHQVTYAIANSKYSFYPHFDHWKTANYADISEWLLFIPWFESHSIIDFRSQKESIGGMIHISSPSKPALIPEIPGNEPKRNLIIIVLVITIYVHSTQPSIQSDIPTEIQYWASDLHSYDSLLSNLKLLWLHVIHS